MVYAFKLDGNPLSTIQRMAECSDGNLVCGSGDKGNIVEFENLDDARHFSFNLKKTLSWRMTRIQDYKKLGKVDDEGISSNSINTLNLDTDHKKKSLKMDIDSLDLASTRALYEQLEARLEKMDEEWQKPSARRAIELISSQNHTYMPTEHAQELLRWLIQGNAFRIAPSCNPRPRCSLLNAASFKHVHGWSDRGGSGGEGGYSWNLVVYNDTSNTVRWWCLIEECTNDQSDSYEEHEIGIRGYISNSLQSIVKESMSDECRRTFLQKILNK